MLEHRHAPPSAIHAKGEINESKLPKKRAVLYARVSTGDQHPETQLCDLRTLAKQRGFEVVREYTDVISGAKSRRPGLDRLLSDARRGQFDVVLVAAFDRVARSTRHFLEILDELNDLGIEFISLRENIDTGDALGRAIVVIVGAIAELEKSLIVERVRAGMRRAKLEGRRIEDWLLAEQADTEGWHGKLKNAIELTRKAMDSAEHDHANEAAAGYQIEAARREVECGNREEARAEATAALKLARSRHVLERAAIIWARSGDATAAEKLAVELGKTFPLDTVVQRYWLPMVRAALALERKDPKQAIELLKLESTVFSSGYIYAPYLRGEAFLMLHDGSAAAAEYKKFIDYRGVVGNFPLGALAHLGLARAYVLQSDPAKARAAYQDFLTLWKDADSDIPILIAAKAEYAKLN